MDSATWCRTPAAASAARRLRPEVSKNSSTALSSNEGELARSLATCTPATASLSPLPVMDDLITSVWDGRIVSESTLTSRINAARKAVGDSGEGQKLIRTIARRGFRFVGEVLTPSNGHQPAPVVGPTPEKLHERRRPGLPPSDRPAIAVLPFLNMSGDPEQEYFSDGISEDIITALSKLRWFFVIARNSSFIYKGKAVHLRQIAEELGVGYVVEGSVRKSDD